MPQVCVFIIQTKSNIHNIIDNIPNLNPLFHNFTSLSVAKPIFVNHTNIVPDVNKKNGLINGKNQLTNESSNIVI